MEASDWAASLANLPEEQRGPLFGLPVPLDDDDGVDDDGDVDRDEEQRGSLFGLPASLNIHHYCHPNQMRWGSCIM